MIRDTTTIARAAVAAAAMAAAGPAPAAAPACLLYDEAFRAEGPVPLAAGPHRIEWCLDGAATSAEPGCAAGQAVVAASDFEDPTLWVRAGAPGCASVRLELRYQQDAPTGTVLRVAVTDDAAPDCDRPVDSLAQPLDAFGPRCAPLAHTIFLDGGESVYWRIDHGIGAHAVTLREVAVTIGGCGCHPGDATGDGRVDVADLLRVVVDWGPCPPRCAPPDAPETPDAPPPTCPADLDGDCTVGVEDLVTVLELWGLE